MAVIVPLSIWLRSRAVHWSVFVVVVAAAVMTTVEVIAAGAAVADQ